MTAMIRELAFDLRDLQQVSIECDNCRTRVVLDLVEFAPTGYKKPHERQTFAPQKCPSCQRDYDSALTALNELQKAYKSLLDGVGGAIQFRVAANKEKAEA